MAKNRRTHFQNASNRTFNPEDFCAFFQPIVQISETDPPQIVGFEALARKFEGNRILSPSDFLDKVKKTGHIRNLDLHVLDESCKLLKQLDRKDLTIGVNLSMETITSENLAETIRHCLKKRQISPHQIKFEILEEAFPSDDAKKQRAIDTIAALAKNGHAIAIDDFGKDESGFERLAELRSQHVKIDPVLLKAKNGWYVEHLLKNLPDGTILIIEGIEDDDMHDCARTLFGDNFKGQGYAYGVPASMNDTIIRLSDPPTLQRGSPASPVI